MLFYAHRAIVALFVILPAMAIVAAAGEAWRIRRVTPLASLMLTFGAGFAIGLALALVYAVGTSGRLIPEQVLKAGYFATGLLLVLKGFDALLRAALMRLAGLRREQLASPVDAGPGQAAAIPVHVRPRRWMRAAFVGIARAAILFAIGLPYVMAAVLTYRPKVAPIDDPQSQLGFAFERITFQATDGTRLVGWWIPAQRPRRGTRPPGWGTRTVLVCHGLAANKSNQLILARQFPNEGFNVLIFDFRAHGESGRQLTTFGDRERFDVLGAIKYLRAHRADEAEQIYGVGASLGAAALIAAAADQSDEGRAIDAIAVYGTYDHLESLTRSIAQSYFFPPLRQLLIHVGLPLASLQTGSNLSEFAPARLVPKVWPRPILIIHGRRDEIINFDHGDALYEAAVQPKYNLWLKEGTHNAIVDNDSAAKLVAEFFKAAEPVPVI
ncbi:MAG TPA: alpha/beta hydrolase [Tepidisphaeraceae bacterium]|nr:alpha/beta hydrolase [Tepidisphaeraceae bacterium]